MNHPLATLLLLSISMSACAQKINETDVPQPVKTAFTTKFPKANGVKWELEDGKDYEAEFKESGKERSATFSPNGQWLETETEIKPAALPAAVTQAIATSFAGSKIEEAETVETPDRGTFYEVELEQGERTLEVQFAADGTVLKQAVEGEDKDEEKD
jgi:hypothetical protein